VREQHNVNPRPEESFKKKDNTFFPVFLSDFGVAALAEAGVDESKHSDVFNWKVDAK